MRIGEGLRNEQIIAALDQAIAGKTDALYKHLGLASGLPGPRANLTIANAFASDAAARGKAVDKLLFAMVALEPDANPGATAREFLPLCGVLALGARAAADPSLRQRVVGVLHDAAEDPRFRVRDAVPVALARIGEKGSAELLDALASWTNGYHQAAAVVLALAEGSWVQPRDLDAAIARLDESWTLAKDAPRAATRWPGWKALVEALAKAPAALATRFGVPIFDRLAAWSDTKIPELKDAIEQNLTSKKLAGRFGDEIARVRGTIAANTPEPRDKARIVEGMRGRGKKRGRR